MRRAIGPLSSSFEPGDHRDTPAEQPAKLLLSLAPQAADITESLGIVALFLANPFAESGLSTSHCNAALLGPCQPQHSILTSMTASRKSPLMDEAPSTPKLLADHRPRLLGGQPPGWSGRPRGVLFAIAGRTGSQRFNSAGQRRGDPGPDPLGERPLGHAPRAPGGAISLSTCTCRGSIGHCATLP
jgi:hypothetical protein